MTSIVEQMRLRADAISADAEQLFTKHSTIRVHRPDHGSRLVFIRLGNYYWAPLPTEGQRIATKLRETYRRFTDTLRVLLKDIDASSMREIDQSRTTIESWINQSTDHYFRTPEDAVVAFRKELASQVDFLDRLFDPAEGESIFVPDTNALLAEPHIERWAFHDSPRFTLVLMPTVLSELDQLKVNGRNENVRDKAKQIIRQLQEYRRRGSLIDGVTIVRDRVFLRALAVEPDFDATLPWLDQTNNDDRLLAGFIEVIRLHPRSPVALVTRDINLANKADFAGLPTVPPPDFAPSLEATSQD